MKLNVGCGTDYRPGFVNIDASERLPKIDKIIDISKESLLSHFPRGQIEYILANDIIEHHFHWEAVRILGDFHCLLSEGGAVEIRVPDAEYIMRSWRISTGDKLRLLFGGQDVPQRRDPAMDISRRQHPEFFCHKYGWTMDLMKRELQAVGFLNVSCKRQDTNFIAYATK